MRVDPKYQKNKCREVISFYKKYGKKPSMRSKDAKEKGLAIWLVNTKTKVYDPGNKGKFDFLLEMAYESGIPDLFKRSYSLDYAVSMCLELISFYKNHGRRPQYYSKDPLESKLYYWASKYVSTVKRGRLTKEYYPVLKSLVEQLGYPEILEPLNYKELAIEKSNKVIALLNKNEEAFFKDSNSETVELRVWLNDMRRRIKTKSSPQVTRVVKRVFKASGYSQVLKPLRDKSSEEDKLYRFIKIVKKLGGIPSQYRYPQYNKEISWYYYRLRLKRDKSKNFNPNLDRIAAEEGLPNLFKDPQEYLRK